MGQTVNLLVYTFGGSNPSSPTLVEICSAEIYAKTLREFRRKASEEKEFLFRAAAEIYALKMRE